MTNDHPVGWELSRIAEELAEGTGAWRSCSGCHELNEGHPTGEWSDVLKCHLGLGCRECGGIGAVWDTSDYGHMANYLAAPSPTSPSISSLVEELEAAMSGMPGANAWWSDCGKIKERLLALQSSSTTPSSSQVVGAAIVPPHCSGSALGFDPGTLYVNKDGGGYIAVNEDDFVLEDDRCEGPDGPEGSVHWIVRLDASEITALRDFLNGAPRTHGTVADYATRLFDLHGFMLLETYREKPAVTVTFPDLKQAQQFHNTLVELSTHRSRPRTATEGSADV